MQEPNWEAASYLSFFCGGMFVSERRAVWTDIKWAPKHLKNFTHAVVVADQKWIEWMAAVLRPFFSMEIRFFHLDELGDARRWLMEQWEKRERRPASLNDQQPGMNGNAYLLGMQELCFMP